MDKIHHYHTHLVWTGNLGTGTDAYRKYERSHEIHIQGKPIIKASSDPSFRGDASKHNPEELFLAALSGCHMLWYLHLCSEAKIIVMEYTDDAIGNMIEEQSGAGRFSEVILKPQVKITDSSKILEAEALHKKANAMCFIANSCNFPVKHEVVVYV
ncbi:MAG: OsmC family protein [Saprospiraceae bacterium]|nr:OsmC family protein [Saprospiraceae bacterium]